MPFQRCYLLASTARPVAVSLITRFISKDNGFGQYSKKVNITRTDVAVSKSNLSSKYVKNNGDCISNPRHNLNVNTIALPRIQQITINSPNEEYLDDSDITLPKTLDTCTEDISDIGPPLTPTFSFAKYANKSQTIRELVKLGVSLYKFEGKEGMVQYILNLDFERDIKPYIRFLHDCGVPADYLGQFLTKNPNIFKEDIDDLHTRIRYLRSHDFNIDMIKTIICKNPNWLLYSTKDIDGRLAYFQGNFKLNGHEVRILTVKAPRVITYKMLHLMANTMTIKEDMGFNPYQVKTLLLKMPRIWIKNRERLFNVFEYARNEMHLQHDFIVQSPNILLCRKTRLQQRHLFLVQLRRAQYDPSKPIYVSPQALISGTDVEFCKNVANTSIDVYNKFLKTF